MKPATTIEENVRRQAAEDEYHRNLAKWHRDDRIRRTFREATDEEVRAEFVRRFGEVRP